MNSNIQVELPDNASVFLISVLCNFHLDRLALWFGEGLSLHGLGSGDGLASFLDMKPGARLLPKGPEGVYFVHDLLPFLDLDHWDGFADPTAVIHNGSQTIAFWAFEFPVPDDDPALIRMIEHFNTSLDVAVPLPVPYPYLLASTGGEDRWRLHSLHVGGRYSPNWIVDTHLREGRRSSRSRRFKKGRV